MNIFQYVNLRDEILTYSFINSNENAKECYICERKNNGYINLIRCDAVKR